MQAQDGKGFGKISLWNRASLGKWLCRFPKESDGLWHKVSFVDLWNSFKCLGCQHPT